MLLGQRQHAAHHQHEVRAAAGKYEEVEDVVEAEDVGVRVGALGTVDSRADGVEQTAGREPRQPLR